MATPPQLTPEQRAAALVKAAEARAARAEIKARSKMGSMSLPEALDSSDRRKALTYPQAWFSDAALYSVESYTAPATGRSVRLTIAPTCMQVWIRASADAGLDSMDS